MAAEMENAGSQELAQFWKEVPKIKIMEHRSVKYLHILSDCLSPRSSGVTPPLVGLCLHQVTLPCSGKCQTPCESAQGQSCWDGGQRTAGAEHSGEFWWKNLVLLKWMYEFPFSFVKFKWKLNYINPPGPDSWTSQGTLKCHKNAFYFLFIGLLSLTSSCGWSPVTPGWSRSSTRVCGSRRSWLSWCWSCWRWTYCVSTCWAPLRSPPDRLSDLCSADVQSVTQDSNLCPGCWEER